MIPLTLQKNEKTHVNAAALPARDRFAFWNDVIATHFCPAENQPGEDRLNFDAWITMRPFGKLSASHIGTSKMSSRRDVRHLRKSPLDCLFVSLLTEGEGEVRQNGRIARQSAGDFVIYDSATPFENSYADSYSGYWLRIPRRVLETRCVNVEAMTARRLSASKPIANIATMLMKSALELDIPSDSPAAHRMAMSLVDILSTAYLMEADMDEADNPRHRNILDRAKALILSRLDDTAMDTDVLVTTLGVSRRTLNRVFALEATTPIRWLWLQRLARAREMLSSGGEQRVSDVALKCGFSDFSHFTRAFKSEFGLPPKQVLAQLH